MKGKTKVGQVGGDMKGFFLFLYLTVHHLESSKNIFFCVYLSR